MKYPLVSILLPCYNAERYLRESIQSILDQTYHNIELILINDGSEDNTLLICQEFEKTNRNIKVVDIPNNVGLISALNKGIEIASGEYIARMDADDISSKNRIEVLLNVFYENTSADIVSSANIVINNESKYLQAIKPKATLPKPLKFVSLFCTPVVHGGVMVKANIFKSNLYEHRYIHSEDYRLFSKLSLGGFKVYNTREPLYKLRLNPRSVSNKYEEIQIATHRLISEENISSYFGKAPGNRILSLIINRFNFNPDIMELKQTFNTLDQYKRRFINKEKCDNVEIGEIEMFLLEQKIDIIIQSIKYSKILSKLLKAVFLLFQRSIYSRRGIEYILSKINKKINNLK